MDVNNKSFFDIVIGFSYHFISQQKCWAFLLWKISTEVSLEHVSNDDQALETKVTKAAVSPKRQSSWDGHGKPPILGLLLDVGESQLGGFCCCGRPEDLGGFCVEIFNVWRVHQWSKNRRCPIQSEVFQGDHWLNWLKIIQPCLFHCWFK